jgi:hypothetical protein
MARRFPIAIFLSKSVGAQKMAVGPATPISSILLGTHAIGYAMQTTPLRILGVQAGSVAMRAQRRTAFIRVVAGAADAYAGRTGGESKGRKNDGQYSFHDYSSLSSASG